MQIRDISKCQDLLSSFNSSREGAKKNKKKKKAYDSYTNKIREERFDDITTQDLMYFFRDVANESGVKYVISNIPAEMKTYKMLLERGYTIQEILSMIEFIFLSEQDYLDKKMTSPRVLISGWCNKIYQDTNLWLEDKYFPNQASKTDREWKDTSEKRTKIGEWGI